MISRAAAIDYLMTNMGWHDEDGYEVDDADEKRAIITDLVNGIPTVEAAPVVFCKDCKYAHMTYGGEVKYCDRISMPDDEGYYGYALYLPGDWFCADGERRDANDAI